MEQAAPALSAPAPSQATTPRFSGVRALGSPNRDGSFFQAAIDHRHQAQAVAIKYIPRSKLAASSHRHVLREVLNHHQLSLNKYPHIVHFKEVFVTPRYLGVVMEQVDGCDLQTYLLKQGGKLQVDIARFLFQQLVLAVDFMHKKGKVHRDLRLSNILVVDSGVMPLIKLRNFSLSKDVADDSPPRGQVGAALFTAPEVVLNVGGHPYDGELVDSWSCGVILFMMLFGHHPFLSPSDMALGESEQVVRLIENEVRGQLYFPEGADPLLCDLLRRMLVPAPKQRYPISSVMLHAWYQKKLPPGALQLNSSYLQVTNYEDVRQSMSTIKQLVQAAAQGQETQQQPASTSALGGANAQQTPAPRAPASSPLVPMRAPTLSLALPAKLASTTVAAPQDAGVADAAAAAAALVDLSRPAHGQMVAWHGLAATQGISIGPFIAQPLSFQHLQAGTTLSLEHAAMRMYALSAEQLQGHPAYGGALSAALLQHQHQL